MHPRVQRLYGAIGVTVFALTCASAPARAASETDGERSVQTVVKVRRAVHRAEQMHEIGKLERALALYEEAAQLAPQNGEVWKSLGNCALALGRAERATEAFRRATQTDSDSPCTRFDLARALAAGGRDQAALDALEGAIRRGYSSAKNMRRSKQLSKLRESERFAELTALSKKLGTMRSRACKLAAKKDWKGAIAVGEELRREMPDRGATFHNLGYAQIMSGRAADSEKSFRRQLDLGYDTHLATYNLACACALQGKREEALRWLARSIDEGFDSHKMLREDSDLAAIRDEAATSARFTTIRRRLLDRLRTQAHAKTAMQLADWEGAKQLYAHMHENFEDLAGRAAQGMAEASFALGDFAEAARWRKNQIAAGRSVPCALYELARCNAQLGANKEAMHWLGKAVDCGRKLNCGICSDECFAALSNNPDFLALQRRSSDEQVLAKFECASWDEVEAWAKKRLTKNTRDGKAWHRLAWAEMRREKWEAALAAFQQQLNCGFKKSSAILNRACTFALSGNASAALQELERLQDLGCGSAASLRSDPDLASLRDQPRFKAILARFDDPDCGSSSCQKSTESK